MHQYSEAWLSLVVDISVKSMLLAGVTGLGLFVLRIRDTNLRHRAWTGVLLGMLAMPALVHVIPSVPPPAWLSFAMSTALTSPDSTADKSNDMFMANLPRNTLDADGNASRPARSNSDAFANSTIAERPTQNLGAADLRDESESPKVNPIGDNNHTTRHLSSAIQIASRLSLTLAIVYSSVAFLFVGRLLIGLAYTHRLTIQASEIDLATPLPLPRRRSLRLLEHTSVSVPVTVGFIHPVVLLPTCWKQWSEAKLKAVLAHELAHVRRADWLVITLAELNRALYWFHPVAWILRRQLSELAERNCDDAAIEANGDRTQYARYLLEIASLCAGSGSRYRPPLHALPMARKRNVEARIDAILDVRRPLARRLGALGIITLFVIGIPAVLLAAALQPGVEEAKQAPTVGNNLGDVTGADDNNPTEKGAPAPQKQEQETDVPTISDLKVETNETGDQTIRFQLIAKQGKRFTLRYRHTPARNRAGNSFAFESQTDEPIPISLRFLYRPDSEAKRTGFALLGGTKSLEIRVDAPGCRPLGTFTIVDAPLPDIPTTEKTLLLFESPDTTGAVAGNSRRLFVVRRKDGLPEINANEPRGELTLAWYAVDKKLPLTGIDRLAGFWRRQEHEIGAAHVVFRHARQMGADLTRDQVNALIHGVDLIGDSKALAALALKLTNRPVDEFNAEDIAHWPQVTLAHMGLKSCVRTKYEGGSSESFRNGEIDIDFQSNNHQFGVWQAGKSRNGIVGLDDLRHRVPTDGDWLKKMHVEDQPDGKLRLTTSDDLLELIADPNNGFVSQFLLRRNGSVVREFLYQAPRTYPGKIVFPTVSIHCNYSEGLLRTFQIIVIDEAKFNESLPSDAFVVTANVGDLICDYRLDEFQSRPYRLEANVPDLVQYLEQNNRQTESPPGGRE